MRVLVLGSGGREHALCWKLRQSPDLKALFCAPGNPGTSEVARNLDVDPEAPDQVVALCQSQSVDLVVVGPEAPLVAGVADALRQAGIAVFGPGREAARIEGSKAFAKEIMDAARVPTAAFRAFTDPEEAAAHARAGGAVVVKADGLAAGKGVVVANDGAEAEAAVRALAQTPAGRTLVLEERLSGEEVSVMALCDGERYLLLPPARDHKRAGEGDTGPNTGGMGAFAPSPGLDDAALAKVGEEVIAPTLAELSRRGLPFRGVLYAGLMLTSSGPKVLEYNCRFGDPETQVLMLCLGDDLLPLLWQCATGVLAAQGLARVDGAAVGVVLAAEGYPASPRKGDAIEGLPLPADLDAVAFHAGTALGDQALVTSGGRVLTICARRPTLPEARAAAYQAAAKVHFRGMHLRRDIASP